MRKEADKQEVGGRVVQSYRSQAARTAPLHLSRWCTSSTADQTLPENSAAACWLQPGPRPPPPGPCIYHNQLYYQYVAQVQDGLHTELGGQKQSIDTNVSVGADSVDIWMAPPTWSRCLSEVCVPLGVVGAEALSLALEALHCRQQVCLHAGLNLHQSVLGLHHLKPQHTHITHTCIPVPVT